MQQNTEIHKYLQSCNRPQISSQVLIDIQADVLRKKTLGGRLSYNFGFWYCVLITGQVLIKKDKSMNRNEGNASENIIYSSRLIKQCGVDMQVQIGEVNAGIGIMYSSAAHFARSRII